MKKYSSLLKNLFVVGSCFFSGLLLLALAVSTLATILFDAQWVRDIAVKLDSAFVEFAGTEERIDNRVPPPHYSRLGAGDSESRRPADVA